MGILGVMEQPAREESDGALLAGDTRFPPGTARAALAHPLVRTMFVGAFLTSIGAWMQQIVLAAWAYDRTGSSTYVGQLVFAQLGPVLFLGIVGGAVADMVDRRKLLLLVCSGRMAFSLLLAAVVATGDPSRLAVFLAALGGGICHSFFMPTYSAMLPSLVGMRDLPGAIALNSTQMNASRVVGPAIGGMAFAAVGAAWVFLVSGLSFLFVMAALLRIKLPMTPRGEPEPVLRRLTGGFRIARADRVVGRALVTVTAFSVLCLVYVGMMPVLAADNLGMEEDSFEYGAFYACFGLGAVAGSIANGTVLATTDKAAIVRRGLLAYSAMVAVLALLRDPLPAYPMVMVVGAPDFGMITALNTALQSRLADNQRGRVMALWTMGFAGTVALANAVFGPVVDEIGMTPVMLFGAAVAVLLAWYCDLRPPEAAERPLSPALAD